jgi:hypothetical protein
MAQTKEEPAMEKNMSLKDVAHVLGVKAYRVQYAIVHGVVPEPKCRISGRRVFEPEDVKRLAAHFGVTLPTGECEAVGV